MKPRSRKYYENRNRDNGSKKGSVSEAGYNELITKTHDKQNPAPEKSSDKPGSNINRNAQDATTVNKEPGE